MRYLTLLVVFISMAGTTFPRVEGGDRYMSLVGMQDTLQAEAEYAHDLEAYILNEEERLQKLRKLSRSFREHSDELSAGNIERHLAHPVNAYLLLSDTLNLTRAVDDNLASGMRSSEALQTSTTRKMLPTIDDVKGAVEALFRIQDIYDLETSQFTEGLLGSGGSNQAQVRLLNAHDCFSIAETAFLNADYHHTIQWMTMALEKYDKAPADTTAPLEKILDFLNYSLYKKDNLVRALIIASRWANVNPNSTNAAGNKKFFEQELAKKHNVQNYTYDESDELPPMNNQRDMDAKCSKDPLIQSYEAVCRGQVDSQQEADEGRQLRCQLVHNDSPLMILAPAKEEELSLSPRLVFFHNILTDRETEIVINIAKPKLEQSGVLIKGNQVTGGKVTSDRVSKSAWIFDEQNRTVETISRRISALTSLTLTHAEAFEVLNYGIGGHYRPHYDFAVADNKGTFTKAAGNRLATFLLYLSDVELGGATAFPRIKAAVQPEKGGAAFWYNLHINGQGDDRTIHGACPVIVGYKWVSNKWFHVGGNEDKLILSELDGDGEQKPRTRRRLGGWL